MTRWNIMQRIWSEVDSYFGDLLAPGDAALASMLEANARAGLPAHDVSRVQGKFLDLLVRLSGARRVLEIGALGGYSTIWLARALPVGGRIVTLEANPRHAKIALANIEHAGVSHLVDLRVGPAIETLPLLEAEGGGPFDFIFIDADKPSNPDYLAWALSLSRPGSVIVADNVVREGKVIDAASADPNVRGVRRFTELIAAEPRLSATALQTVGAKGYDGFVLAIVVE
jgi:predicted O-methyltransferase YrrM